MRNSNPTGRYARILLDSWFKRSFGSEPRKRLLLLFLRELIPERFIESIRYSPQEHVSPFPGMKGVRVDVECTDESGVRFVVEMQLAHQDFFYERAVFNSTFAIQEQMVSGQESYGFPDVYFIGILDFSIHKGSERVLYRYELRERESYEVMSDRIHYYFLELPNCSRALTPEASVLDNFCYALHNMESLTGRPEGLEGEIFRLLFESAEISKFTPKEKVKYEYEMRTERDIKNQLAYARRIGKEEGVAEGEERGLTEGRAAAITVMTERMRREGIDEATIARLTDFSGSV